MLKQIILIILLSITVIFFTPAIQHGLHAIVSIHDWIDSQLKEIFSVGEAGRVIRELIALMVVPVLAGIIPGVIYWLIKRTWSPYTLEVIWIVWFMQATAIVLMYVPIAK